MRASGLGGEADPARTPDSKVHPRFRVRQRQPPPKGRVRSLGSLQSVEAVIRGRAPSQNPVMPMVRSKKPVRLGLAAFLLLAAAVAAIALFSSDEPSGPQAPGNPADGFGVGNWPPASWRPYADDSTVQPGAARQAPPAPELQQGGGPAHAPTAGRPTSEPAWPIPTATIEHPTYWSTPSDPLFTVHSHPPLRALRDRGHALANPRPPRPAGGYGCHRWMCSLLDRTRLPWHDHPPDRAR